MRLNTMPLLQPFGVRAFAIAQWLALISCIGFAACAQNMAQTPTMNGEPSIGIIHGPNHAYTVAAPQGWVLDNKAWAHEKIFAVFYPNGASIQSSPILAYTTAYAKTREGLDAHIQADLQQMLKAHPGAHVQQHAPLTTRDGRAARVYTVSGVPNKYAQWMAYIDAPTVVIFVAVGVRNVHNLEQGGALLQDLVSSIAWHTDRVQYRKYPDGVQ